MGIDPPLLWATTDLKSTRGTSPLSASKSRTCCYVLLSALSIKIKLYLKNSKERYKKLAKSFDRKKKNKD